MQTMQYHVIPCNTMQYHASLITDDGAYHCPVGSIRPFFIFTKLPKKRRPLSDWEIESIWHLFDVNSTFGQILRRNRLKLIIPGWFPLLKSQSQNPRSICWIKVRFGYLVFFYTEAARIKWTGHKNGIEEHPMRSCKYYGWRGGSSKWLHYYRSGGGGSISAVLHPSLPPKYLWTPHIH